MNSDDTVNLDAPKPTSIAEGPPPVGVRHPETALCPRCNSAIAAKESLCPYCGYDFPFGGVSRGPGLAFSTCADVVLIIAAGIATLGCVTMLVAAVLAVVAGQLGSSLAFVTFAFLLLALVIVFLRAQRIEPRDPRRP